MHTIILHVLYFSDDSYVFVLFSELTIDQIYLKIPDYYSDRKPFGKMSKRDEKMSSLSKWFRTGLVLLMNKAIWLK
jgi:hypothetical protein